MDERNSLSGDKVTSVDYNPRKQAMLTAGGDVLFGFWGRIRMIGWFGFKIFSLLFLLGGGKKMGLFGFKIFKDL